MRLNSISRIMTGLMFGMLAVLFGGVVLILMSAGMPQSLPELIATDSPARETVLFLLVACAAALVCTVLLLSRSSFSSNGRLLFLIVGVVLAVGSLIFASSTTIPCLLPLWFFYRWYRETAA